MKKDLLTGFLITTISLALIDGLSGILSASAEWARTSISVKIAENQAKINRIAVQDEKERDIRAIGFTIPGDPDEEESEEYDD